MIDTSQLLLAQYDQIKQEQRARIGFRDNLILLAVQVVRYAELGH
ncbi:hypothetical protein [Streptomyces cyaneogriseus]|nr:hypothetical protein [Streptomyces cyaneogriseus]